MLSWYWIKFETHLPGALVRGTAWQTNVRLELEGARKV